MNFSMRYQLVQLPICALNDFSAFRPNFPGYVQAQTSFDRM